MSNIYPVIDLFAGPGGLGEGFASLQNPRSRNRYAFRTSISIENDVTAHRTLQLRHFFREFPPDNIPNDYYAYLNGDISIEILYKNHPKEAARAKKTAWRCTLGEESHSKVQNKISKALKNQARWVLVGGPPCQAYSLVGRSRMMGDPSFESDHRHFLYREYLQILADHTPPVFVMENVKGLLSAKINDEYVIKRILNDLSSPIYAVTGNASDIEYNLYSLSESGIKNKDDDPSSFVVKAEEYGIPQARHRILILGIRNDIHITPRTLEKTEMLTVQDVIGDLPKLRSGISREPDSREQWVEAITNIIDSPWFIKGRSNGLSEFVETAEEILASFENSYLERSNNHYSPPSVLRDWFYDERLSGLTSHETRTHMISDLHRYFFASLYAQIKKTSPKLSDFPKDLLPDHKNIEAGISGEKFSDRFRVQLPTAPATTITSHISKDGHYFIHYDPKQCRSLTVREAARLQTFPDNYQFEGYRTAQYHQIGNAVPPLLANKIAKIVYDVLEAMN